MMGIGVEFILAIAVLVILFLGVPMFIINEKIKDVQSEVRSNKYESFDNAKAVNEKVTKLYEVLGYEYETGGRAVKKVNK